METESTKPEANTLPEASPAGKLDRFTSLQPRSLEEAWRVAGAIARSTLVPKEFQNNTANVSIAVQLGYELGLNPIQSLQSVCVINGRPVVWGDAALAIVQKSGLLERIQEDATDDGASCMVKRKGQDPITRTFSVDDAKTAGLWGKRGASGQPTPWVTYPRRMLQMRARGFALRDAFADVLKGLYVREEVDETENDPISTAVDRIWKSNKERYARLPAWPHWARKELALSDDRILACLQTFERRELTEPAENWWAYLVRLAQEDLSELSKQSRIV
jgi:hypothetical protein